MNFNIFKDKFYINIMITNNLNHFIEKYKPLNIDDVIGNRSAIFKLDKWIKNIDEKKEKFIIISGKNGIGKSLIINLIFKKYNYNHLTIYPEEIKNYRQNLKRPIQLH